MTTYYLRTTTAEASRIIAERVIPANMTVEQSDPLWGGNAGPFFTLVPPKEQTWTFDLFNKIDPADAVVLAFTSNRSAFPKPIDRDDFVRLANAAKTDPSAIAHFKGGMVHMTIPFTGEEVATTVEPAPNALSLLAVESKGGLSRRDLDAAARLIGGSNNYISIVH